MLLEGNRIREAFSTSRAGCMGRMRTYMALYTLPIVKEKTATTENHLEIRLGHDIDSGNARGESIYSKTPLHKIRTK